MLPIVFSRDGSPNEAFASRSSFILIGTITADCAAGVQPAVATRINDLIFKVRPEDVEKMALVEKLIDQYVDIDRIASLL